MPPRNTAFEKALALLVHPISLFALGLMLVNDHILRRLWPSWWTGKFSDIAWLWIMPIVLAALLAWVIPERANSRGHERIIFIFSFLLTGFGFTLAKLLPAVNAWFGVTFHALTGAAASLALDPTDLLALPALAAVAWFWHRRRSTPVQRPRAWIVLILSALVLLADAAAPDPGITCFEMQNGRMYAAAGYQSYVTNDGGLTWESWTPGQSVSCTAANADADLLADWREFPGPDENTRFRYQKGVEIQRSTDGGQTWQTAYRLEPISEAERAYYIMTSTGNPTFETGPLYAMADPTTGNMLFAMGHQGVLVYTAQGEWVWATGTDYQRIEQFPNADSFVMLLGGMLLLAIELALVIFSAMAMHWTRHWLRITVLVIAGLGWLAITFLFPPALSTGYTVAVTDMGILVVALLILPLGIEQMVRLFRRARHVILILAGIAMLGGLMYFIPYTLWLYNALPKYITASVLSLILAVTVLVGGLIVAGKQK